MRYVSIQQTIRYSDIACGHPFWTVLVSWYSHHVVVVMNMSTVKPNNNQQMRIFKYIGTKSWNTTDPLTRVKSSLIAFKNS